MKCNSPTNLFCTGIPYSYNGISSSRIEPFQIWIMLNSINSWSIVFFNFISYDKRNLQIFRGNSRSLKTVIQVWIGMKEQYCICCETRLYVVFLPEPFSSLVQQSPCREKTSYMIIYNIWELFSGSVFGLAGYRVARSMNISSSSMKVAQLRLP